ncbi:hypothetical protein SASPL_112784 [Salvia splendens]|uniref:DUF7750 domain-containing protein n=1 Tax=Salvia splendens TaxID=180675 RepID=A0A8X9A4I7_SALSN|nr:uncharacterized protein LOC121799976 [Salvia splendens]KAG6428532.1 hypothetical protein SASPL_112784 [Salvia splendens]
MTLASGQSVFLLPPSSIHRHGTPPYQHPRAWKRRRLKPPTVRCEFNSAPPPLDNLVQGFLSQLLSVGSLDLLAPAVGFASGVALFLSSKTPKLLPNPKSATNSSSDIGEWILFTSPTPFNRFVTLRCPSIDFPENELMENVSEKLVKEDRHYVKLNSGRIIHPAESSGGSEDEKLVYQRLCIGTEDGGVLSLDWPANLDLEEERGFDTTVLIVPGTAEGSSERKIRAFVCDCLRRGVFPLVMNPRGCATSPLTTPRLFTAADSDDISKAVQYLIKRRPWTTLMAVGWGYGANMLTKYLAEFGERTPLTAAICIDNPFDLEEATRSTVYHPDYDQRQTDGLIEILRCNKELFQGRSKGFDVEKALSASSVRDFERAISMVSYGYDTIEDFYAKSSTRDVIDKVKVPVLFIQNDDIKAPYFSIPRSLIAKNPYTSLLLCSYKPSSKIMNDRSTFSWCQHLALEWLSAVEIGLLKGRHPLLKDVDVTINPSKGLALVEGRASPRREGVSGALNLTDGSSTNPQLGMFQVNGIATGTQLESNKDTGHLHIKGLQLENNNAGERPDAAVDPTIEDVITPSEVERGQVLQTAEVIMNMLDITMPDTLTDEQKKKVFTAVGKGETVMKALQDAVPDDVRGKLTTAVSGILQSQGSDLNFDKLLKLGHNSKEAPKYDSKVLDKDAVEKAIHGEDVQALDQKKRTNDVQDSSSSVDHSPDMSSRDMKSEKQTPKIIEKASDPIPDLGNGSHNEMGKSNESGDNTVEISDKEIVAEVNPKQDSSSMFDGPDVAEGTVDLKKVEEGSGIGNTDPTNKKIEQESDISNDQKAEPNTEEKSTGPPPTSEAPAMENKAENNQGKEEKDPISALSQNMGDSSTFSVSQAFDALTGFDDSTQVAVNNVFNVIEGMIDQLEEKKGDMVDEVKNKKSVSEGNGVVDVKEFSKGSVSKNHLPQDDPRSSGTTNANESPESGNPDGTTLQDKEHSWDINAGQNHAQGSYNYNSTDITNTGSQVKTGREICFLPASGEVPAENVVTDLSRSSETIPTHIGGFPYADPLYKEYLKTYLSLKMKNANPQGVNKPPALYLDYIAEEGKWKISEQTENDTDYGEDKTEIHPRSKNSENTIEPSYMILDSDKSEDPNEELEKGTIGNNAEFDEGKFDGSTPLIKSLILKCLEVEVGRRVSAFDLEDLELKLAEEMEYVANAVSVEAGKGMHHMEKSNGNLQGKHGILDGENVVKAISSAVEDTEYLRTVLPIGVILGSSLAALRKFFDVAAMNGDDEQILTLDQVDKPTERLLLVGEKESRKRSLKERQSKDNFTSYIDEETSDDDTDHGNSEAIMGAVTAALGASALLANQHEPLNEEEQSKGSFEPDEMDKKTETNIVASLAEKAMSVASPVVPMKEDGGVDHERIVSMLAELGQKGGIRLIGKVALLWGGIRGAMSLVDKLISFLRLSERPLFQRILGFVFMVLLLWSPVVLPLLPTLVQNWATRNPFKIAEFACIAGLYISTMSMIMLWGKRIRKYDDPLMQYGFDLASLPKLQDCLKGLAGGVVLVTLIHTVNALLGSAHLHWPTTLSLPSSDPVASMKAYGRMLLLIVRGTAAATLIASVEELLFLSWLPQEIAADSGFYRGVFISGLLFALSQRSLLEIPGLWLLSISLSGARQRNQGSLSIPIGLRAGIMASNFILRTGGFLSYQPTYPLWVAGVRPFKPFSGVVGLAFSLVLVAILYPKQPIHEQRGNRVIRE